MRHIVVIGGGPAGLMAAAEAARCGARVTVLERQDQCGRKLLVTGGGRCNITNRANADAMRKAFGAAGSHVRQALRILDSAGLRAYLQTRGLRTVVLEEGCVFPVREQAADVLGLLLHEAASNNIEIRTAANVQRILIEEGAVCGVLVDGEDLAADAVILATGGPAWKSVGADASGLDLARTCGHAITPLTPALAPLLVDDPALHALAGTVIDPVVMRICGEKKRLYRGALLITHRGISGPVALDASGDLAVMLATSSAPVTVTVQFTPSDSIATWDARLCTWQQEEGRKLVHSLIAPYLSTRLAEYLCSRIGVGATRAAELGRSKRQQLCTLLCACPIQISGTGHLRHAMVTRGGVDLSAVQPKTLQSRVVRSLYFAGEVLDCDGPCGGYNLQWACSSGMLAGRCSAAGG